MLLEGNFVPFNELPQVIQESYDVENIALLFIEAAESEETEMLKEKELLDEFLAKVGPNVNQIKPQDLLRLSAEIPELSNILEERAAYKKMLFLLDTSGPVPQTLGFVPYNKVTIKSM